MQAQSSQLIGKRAAEEQELTKTELFQSVISKYFEIIKTILPRISTLYLENEQFQRNLYLLQSKMAKVEKDHENLHYQMRANHLSTDNKLNHILSEYSLISNDYSRIKQQNEDLSREIKEIKYIQNVQKQHQDRQDDASNAHFKKEKTKKITFLEIDIQKQPESLNLSKSKKSLKFIQRKSSINLEIDEPSIQFQEDNHTTNEKELISRINIEPDSTSSIHNSKGESQKSIDLNQRQGSMAMKSEKVMVRKTNLKSSAKLGLDSSRRKESSVAKSQRVFASSEEQLYSGEKYKLILKQIEDFYKKNQSMKTNYEYLMGQYCRTNEEQFSKLEEQIQQLKTKITEIDILHTHFEKIKIQLETKINTFQKDIELKINSKMDLKMFQNYVEQTNTRITGVHEERKKLANKDQTKRAIEFLQTKLNYVIGQMLPDVDEKYPKLHLVQLEISHLTSRVQALPISKQKNSFYMSLGEKKAHLEGRHATVTGACSSKRQPSSMHYNIRSDKMITEEKSESCSLQKDRLLEDGYTLRVKKPTQKDNLTYLKDKSRQLLSRGEKSKQRTKLRKERILFSYD